MKDAKIIIEHKEKADFKNGVLISNKAVNDLIKNGKALTIYINMLDHQQHKGLYIGTQKDLSKKLNISLATLNKYLRYLIKEGYIQTIRQGKNKGTIYIVNLEKSA